MTLHSKFLGENLNRNLFITSGPQFGSKGVFNHVPARKLFGHFDRLQRAMVENWNAVVGPEDAVLCLGDFTQNLKSIKKSRSLVEKYTRQLSGRKILLRGNHDAEDTGWYYDCGWNCVIEYPLIIQNKALSWLAAPTRFCGCLICEIDGYRILFSHLAIHEDDDKDRRYPVEKAYLRDLFKRYHCHINIHGHTHDRPVGHADCFSVCSEQTLFTPLTVSRFLTQFVSMPERKLA